jgi:hypothetical protein
MRVIIEEIELRKENDMSENNTMTIDRKKMLATINAKLDTAKDVPTGQPEFDWQKVLSDAAKIDPDDAAKQFKDRGYVTLKYQCRDGVEIERLEKFKSRLEHTEGEFTVSTDDLDRILRAEPVTTVCCYLGHHGYFGPYV